MLQPRTNVSPATEEPGRAVDGYSTQKAMFHRRFDNDGALISFCDNLFQRFGGLDREDLEILRYISIHRTVPDWCGTNEGCQSCGFQPRVVGVPEKCFPGNIQRISPVSEASAGELCASKWMEIVHDSCLSVFRRNILDPEARHPTPRNLRNIVVVRELGRR